MTDTTPVCYFVSRPAWAGGGGSLVASLDAARRRERTYDRQARKFGYGTGYDAQIAAVYADHVEAGGVGTGTGFAGLGVGGGYAAKLAAEYIDGLTPRARARWGIRVCGPPPHPKGDTMTTYTIDALNDLAEHVARVEADAACRDDDTRDPPTLAAGVARVTLEVAGLPVDADTVARFDRLVVSRLYDELALSWWAPAPDLAEQLLEEASPGFGRDPVVALLWGMANETPPGEYADTARRFVADALERWRAAHPGRRWPTSQAHLDETVEALENMLETAEPWLSYDHIFEVWADDEAPVPGTGQTRHAVALGRQVLGEETGLARGWLASARVGEEGAWAGMVMRRIA